MGRRGRNVLRPYRGAAGGAGSGWHGCAGGVCRRKIKKIATDFSLINCDFCVALEGFEPSQAEPESDVLPLHHKARCRCQLD